MKNFFSFFKKDYFLNLILFSLITIVFLNHIHNSISPYQKTPLKFEGKETYFVIEKSQLKKNCRIFGRISQNLVDFEKC